MKTKTHRGDLIITLQNQKDFADLTEVSGYVDVRQGATFTAPALTEVSGYVDVRQGATFTAPALKVKNNEAVFDGKTYKIVYFDGMTFVVKSERTSKGIKIYSGFHGLTISDSKLQYTEGFICQKEGFTAHGETLKKSMSDLQFKIVAEKIKTQPINEDTVITDMYYRTITGACELGVKEFRRQNGITAESITAKELLPLLKKSNAYGYEKFKSLITF